MKFKLKKTTEKERDIIDFLRGYLGAILITIIIMSNFREGLV